MAASPTLQLICEDPSIRVQLIGVLSASGYPLSVFENVEKCLQSLREHGVQGPIVDATGSVESLLAIQRGLQALNVSLPVVSVAHAGDETAIQAIEPQSVRFCPSRDYGSAVVAQLDAITTKATSSSLRVETLMDRLQKLSPREREVMDRVVRGMMNKQIASDLGLSAKTIEVHRAHVMDKMQADSLAELVRMAVRLEDAGQLRAA